MTISEASNMKSLLDIYLYNNGILFYLVTCRSTTVNTHGGVHYFGTLLSHVRDDDDG